MKYEITGRVREAESQEGVPGLVVSVFDKDRLFDDLLGEVTSDAGGHFRLEYDQSRLAALFEGAPDIYVTVKTPAGQSLHTTGGAVRFNAQPREEFHIDIPREALEAAGLRTARETRPVSRETLTTLTCLAGAAADDALVNEIKADVAAASSVLETMKDYMAQLEGNWNNDAAPFRKMARLFELGKVFERLDGHYYGVAPGLRTGDLRGVAAEYGNLLGYVWGSAVVGVCPWGGKSYKPMSEGERAQIVGRDVPPEVPVLRGINHFNRIEQSAVNISLTALLTFMWHLQEAPPPERLKYGYELNGGHFAAHRAPSLYHGTPREVFRLNYRYHALGNFPPLHYLVDEMVEIAAGLYLGQVLFATDHLLERYDPEADPARYRYQHFGYFLLFEPEWNVEAQRLFPFLQVPEAAVTTRVAGPEGAAGEPGLPAKFTTLTLADPADGNVDAGLLAEAQRDVEQYGDIMRLLKAYSDVLIKQHDTTAPEMRKLFALFNAGRAPARMDGYYRGALVSWNSPDLLGAFDLNTVNVVWQAARHFSPWLGKQFREIDEAELAEWTDGGDPMGTEPAWFASNEVAFRTAKERFTHSVMKLAGVWMQDATPEEKLRYGYDAHTFFFIGRPHRPSKLADNRGKRVYQFNYRWPKLRNIPPDCFCIDEIVQIADGLHLGMLLYATDWLKPWSPQTPDDAYKYRLFGYFLLMDEEWHAQRLRVGLDLYDT
jgi:hypothetical protein